MEHSREFYLEDRIGGEEIQHMKIVDFKTCLEDCKLTEVRSIGAYYTWMIWLRIDRVLANSFWYQEMKYTHVTCSVEGLSNYAPLMITLPTCPKSKTTFMFCEI